MVKRDVIQAFAITLAGLLSLYLSDFGILQNRFLLAFEGYVLLLFFIGSVVLRSVRHGFFATFSALLSVSFLSILHILSLPSYDALAPVSYFAVLLFSFLLNIYVLYGRFIVNKPLFRVYEDSKFALTVAVIATIGTGLALATQEMMEQFGLLLMVGSAVRC